MSQPASSVVVVNCFDEALGISRPFEFDRDLLCSSMRWGDRQGVGGQSWVRAKQRASIHRFFRDLVDGQQQHGEKEISVHCDSSIFALLHAWVHHADTKLTVEIVLPVLIASSFLKVKDVNG